MVSWMYNTSKNAKTVFMHISALMLAEHWSLCVHGQIGYYNFFVMVSWIYNTENNAKSVFMHFSEVMLHGLSLCVHCQIDHYRKLIFFKNRPTAQSIYIYTFI
jgi:cold shock CspA family protein